MTQAPKVLDYAAVKAWDFEDIRQSYTARDTILYALGAGYGFDPEDERQLPFVYEEKLAAAPTMLAALGHPGPWWADPRTGVDYSKNLHGEQDLTILRPPAPEAEIVARNRVLAVHDRGPGRGAVARIGRDIYDARSGDLLARNRRIEILRAAGGFSADSGHHDPRPETLERVTTDAPSDRAVELPVLPQAHLIYRLSGDYNALHVDHEAARAAGFPRPILHGLATFAMAGHAALRALCDYRPERLGRLAMRLAAPVLPGDRLRFEFWRDGAGRARFRADVRERSARVVDCGVAEFLED